MKKKVLMALRPTPIRGGRALIDPDTPTGVVPVPLPDDHGLPAHEVALRIANKKLRWEEIEVEEPRKPAADPPAEDAAPTAAEAASAARGKSGKKEG